VGQHERGKLILGKYIRKEKIINLGARFHDYPLRRRKELCVGSSPGKKGGTELEDKWTIKRGYRK